MKKSNIENNITQVNIGKKTLPKIYQNIWQKIKIIFKADFCRTIVKYSFAFLIIALYLIMLFNKFNKSFIWAYDGLHQHVITLQYYRNLIINFIRSGTFSTFTWNIGLGLDMFSNLAYYIFGDFLSLLSLLFPTKSIDSVYNILVIIRIYFIGLSFICYCKYKNMNSFSSIVGALMYAFCGFVIYSGTRHPYFSNSVMLLPLIFIGIEKIIVEDKSLYYTIMISVLFIINFYFAYTISIIIAIYGIILAIYTYKREGFKKIVKVLLKTLLYSIIGIMISGLFLIPTGIGFINSERTATNTIYPYIITYYRNLINNLIMPKSNGYWLIWGTQSIIFISLPIFIRRRKENKPLFLTMLILFLPLLSAKIGSIFCGFNYPSNRWAFALVFIFSYATTIFLNSNKLDKQDLRSVGIFGILYFLANVFFEINISTYIEFQILLAIIMILLLVNRKKLSEKFQKINLFKFFLIFTLSLGILSSIKYLYEDYNYISQFLDKNALSTAHSTSDNTIVDFNKVIKYINDNDSNFYKVSKYPYKHENISLIKDFNSIGQYYSITPEIYGELNIDLANSEYYINLGAKEFDYRTKINTLLGNKYYISGNNKNPIPYGYSLDKKYKGTSKIYKNNYALPFAILYNKYITEEEFNKFTPLEKESIMLKSVALSSNDNNNQINYTTDLNFDNIKEISYIVKDYNNIIQNKNEITIRAASKNSFKINVKETLKSEVYIILENLQYVPFTKEEMIYFAKENSTTEKEKFDIKNKYKWYEPAYDYNIYASFNNITKSRKIYNFMSSPYYMSINDFTFNLGYYDKASGDITISLSKIGHYTFDAIKVYAVSMEGYEEDINNLRKSNFELKDYGNGYLNGTVDCEESGVLQFSTLYAKGWKVYVDDELVDSFKSNKYFLGINIEKGKHNISLKYHNPYIKYGDIISIIGIVSLVILTKKNKSKQK